MDVVRDIHTLRDTVKEINNIELPHEEAMARVDELLRTACVLCTHILRVHTADEDGDATRPAHADANADADADADNGHTRRVRQRREELPTREQHEAAHETVLRTTEFLHYKMVCLQATLRTNMAWFSMCAAHTPVRANAPEQTAASIARAAFTFGALTESEEPLNRLQVLNVNLLNILQLYGYRRVDDKCYAPIISPCGRYSTRAYKYVCTIPDFVDIATRKETNFELWQHVTKTKCNFSAAVERLMHIDAQFPTLHKDRHVFAFRNGLYITSCDALAHNRAGSGAMGLGDAFVPYGPHEAFVPDNGAACKYFDTDFLAPPGVNLDMRPHHIRRLTKNSDPHFVSAEERAACDIAASDADTTWKDIPTPHLQSIFDHQRFPAEVSAWAYVFIGRLLYDVNELDGWQVIPFFKGMAGTGKSTLLNNVCQELYDFEDVTVLSNNNERKFGISGIADKYMFIAPEIKSDLKLDQAEFQSMVSGEKMRVAVKHKTASTVQWKTPGILAGNETPKWVDNSGSITRRVIVFSFDYTVHPSQVNLELNKELASEIPLILIKCNRAYQAAVRRVGKQCVWNCLPDYFKDTATEMTNTINPLEDFMASGKLRFAPDAYMPLYEWQQMCKAHCEENNLGNVNMTPEKTKPLFNTHGVRISLAQSLYPRKYPRHSSHNISAQKWCEGVEPAAQPSMSSSLFD